MSISTSANLVFDLDGTLVDTKKAVFEAYRYVGVNMPEDAWGKNWREWLTGPDAEKLHKAKNTIYLKTVGLYAQPLELLPFVEKAGYPVITGASMIAAETIAIKFAPKLRIALREATLDMKAKWLNDRRPGVYVDDDVRARSFIEEKTKWKTWDPDQCLQSFLQPEPIHV